MISTNEITIMIILIAFILIASICIGFCIVTFGGKINELGSGGSIALYFMPIYTLLMALLFLIFFFIYRKEIKNGIDLIRSVKKILPLYELLTKLDENGALTRITEYFSNKDSKKNK